MGTWGYGLYQNDIAQDVKSYYTEQLHFKDDSKAITNELISEHQFEIQDEDLAPVFWFALADTQWNLGRLEEIVKVNALKYIESGNDLMRWSNENPSQFKSRKAVLDKLESKLKSPQPPKKKIRRYRLYKCEWKKGDVFAYRLKSDYAKENGLYGRYFLFQKVDETVCYPGHIVPVVWVKITESTEIPLDKTAFEKLQYVKTSWYKYEPFSEEFHIDSTGLSQDEYAEKVEREKERLHVDDSGYIHIYRLILSNTSKRSIPKDLLYVGNFSTVRQPEFEYVPKRDVMLPEFLWRDFEENMIKRYISQKGNN